MVLVSMTVEFPDDELELDEELDAEFDEAESEGLADATHGVAASPAPMPRATANAPIRPLYVAYPMVVPSLGRATVWRVFWLTSASGLMKRGIWTLRSKSSTARRVFPYDLGRRCEPDMVIVLGCPPALGSPHLVACCAGSQQAGLDAFGVGRQRGASPVLSRATVASRCAGRACDVGATGRGIGGAGYDAQ